MGEIAAQAGQAAAHEGQGLVHPFRSTGQILAPQQALQSHQAIAGARHVVGHDDRGGVGDRQGEMVVDAQVAEETDNGVHLAFAQQVEAVLFDHR
ncbi:hypothetical protein D3C80_1208020 [compost metagenome]